MRPPLGVGGRGQSLVLQNTGPFDLTNGDHVCLVQGRQLFLDVDLASALSSVDDRGQVFVPVKDLCSQTDEAAGELA